MILYNLQFYVKRDTLILMSMDRVIVSLSILNLYKTREQSEYLDFYNSFDFDTYEIVDISTTLQTYKRGYSYMITYRMPI